MYNYLLSFILRNVPVVGDESVASKNNGDDDYDDHSTIGVSGNTKQTMNS